jgi:hypothetical protein
MMKSRRMRMVGHVARIREKSNTYRLLVGKLEGKNPLGRPRRRWMDSIRVDLGEILDTGDINSGNFLGSCTTSGFSRRALYHRISITIGADICTLFSQ